MLFNSNAFTLLYRECHYFLAVTDLARKIQNPKLIGFVLFND
jgi:hypothetical protein